MDKTVHILKTEATCWDAIQSGEKRFEVRKNDRFFQRGDIVRLRKVEKGVSGILTPKVKSYGQTYGEYQPPAFFDIDFRIGWILQGGQFGIEPRYIVFQLEPVDG